MKKAYRYRLYPTKKQETILNQQLALCCELYNAALQERRDAYRLCGKSISFTHQSSARVGFASYHRSTVDQSWSYPGGPDGPRGPQPSR